MRFNKLDLNLLVELDALLTERNISRAGERIHLSQSAMSNALARLREYFEDELLVQVGHKMEPTTRAQSLKDPVRDILVHVEASVTAQPQFVPSQSTRLFRLLISDYTLMTLVPHLQRLAYKQAPGVQPAGARAIEAQAVVSALHTGLAIASWPADSRAKRFAQRSCSAATPPSGRRKKASGSSSSVRASSCPEASSSLKPATYQVLQR